MEHYSKTRFDVVVTDHKMSRMDGIELAARIREVNPSARIIMLCGFMEAVGLTEQATGADLLVPKGANEVSHLVRGVARLLRSQPPRKAPAAQKPAARAKRAAS